MIGLSGGINSALSCALAAEALGPDNVLAIRMPYKTSSADSLEDAEKTATRFGVRMETIEITPMVEPMIQLDPQISKSSKRQSDGAHANDRLVRSV